MVSSGSGSALRGSGLHLRVVTLGVMLLVAPLYGCSKGASATKSSSARSTAKASAARADTASGPTTTGQDLGTAEPSGADDASATAKGSAKPAKGGTSGPRGNINKVEPARPDPGTLAPVGISDVADFGSGVTVRVAGMEPTEATAKLPGEIAGPAVLVTVELRNATSKPVDLDGVAVTMTDASGGPVIAHMDPRAVPFSGSVAPGATASGTYLFRIDPVQREDVTLTVKYSSETPTAIMRGSLPNG